MESLEFKIILPAELGIQVVGFQVEKGATKFVYFDRNLGGSLGVSSLFRNYRYAFHPEANSGLYLPIPNRLLSTLWKPSENKLSVLGNYDGDFQNICDEKVRDLEILKHYQIYLEKMKIADQNGSFGELGFGYFSQE